MSDVIENTGSVPAVKKPVKVSAISINQNLARNLKAASTLFADMGNKRAVSDIDIICKRGIRNRFSVAVVGEFSRGKSTFINTLLEKEVLPVGNMPTTAMLTRIRFSEAEKMVHFTLDGKHGAEMPLTQDSWDGLVAENFGKSDPSGTVLVGVNSLFMRENNIELLDTPGAGDLEEKRAKIIGDALLGSDGAIITISAASALSMSEKMFIEQRLLSRKTPFLMLIITKLDTIPLNERNTVIRYVLDKLASWKMKIPVYVPYDVETVNDTYKNIIGLDKVKNQIVRWITDPERVAYTESWLSAQASAVINRELSALEEQKMLIDADDESRKKLIAEKEQKLISAENTWGSLKLEMISRSSNCYDILKKKAADYAVQMTERLQYEVSHTNSPQKWWENDYPYRLKVELTNMSTGIENVISQEINKDVRWFNTSLENNFKTHVMYEREVVADRDVIASVSSKKALSFENIDKQRTAAKIGTTALSIAGYAVCASFGFIPLIATMGIGTGSAIVTDKVFSNKIEAQRETIRCAIAEEIPDVISEALSDSESRIASIYDSIVSSAEEKEKAWKESQKAAIVKSVKNIGDEEKKNLDLRINRLYECLKAFS